MNRTLRIATRPSDDEYKFGAYVLNKAAVRAMFNPRCDVEVLVTDKILKLEDMCRTYVLNSAGGIAITLPLIDVQSVGLWVRVEVMTTVTATDDYIIQAGASGDPFEGNVFISEASDFVANQAYFAADGTDYILTMDGGDTGGLIGTSIFIQANANGYWSVSGIIMADGTLTTNPFS